MTETDKKQTEKSATTVKQRGWPWWAKTLISLVVIAITGAFALGLTVIFGMKRLGNDMVNPVLVEKAAHEIADFPEPLPDGYQYLLGLNLPEVGLSTVTIEHQPDKQLLTFSLKRGEMKGDLNDLLDFANQLGLNMLITTAKITDVTERGKVKVGEYEIPFIRGKTIDVNQQPGEGFVGALQTPVKQPKKNILIYALQSGKVPYNQQITMNLLNSIKRF